MCWLNIGINICLSKLGILLYYSLFLIYIKSWINSTCANRFIFNFFFLKMSVWNVGQLIVWSNIQIENPKREARDTAPSTIKTAIDTQWTWFHLFHIFINKITHAWINFRYNCIFMLISLSHWPHIYSPLKTDLYNILCAMSNKNNAL